MKTPRIIQHKCPTCGDIHECPEDTAGTLWLCECNESYFWRDNIILEKRIPAFPESCNGQIVQGMSLRDYFAGQALVGLLSMNRDIIEDGKGNRITIQKASFLYADGMLKEREK